MKQFHDIQLAILRKLLFAEALRYSELKPEETMENNQLSFHLDKLIELDYVEKLDGDIGSSIGYSLTIVGKEYANRMDTETNKIKKQPKSGVLVVPMRYNKELKENEFLFYTRKKHPHFGKQGFITGKIDFGEVVAETALRELEEEAGLIGKAELIGIEHLINTAPGTGNTLEDKFFYVFRVVDIEGEIACCEEGEYYRVPKSEIANMITRPFTTLERTLDFVDKIEDLDSDLYFKELVFETEEF